MGLHRRTLRRRARYTGAGLALTVVAALLSMVPAQAGITQPTVTLSPYSATVVQAVLSGFPAKASATVNAQTTAGGTAKIVEPLNTSGGVTVGFVLPSAGWQGTINVTAVANGSSAKTSITLPVANKAQPATPAASTGTTGATGTIASTGPTGTPAPTGTGTPTAGAIGTGLDDAHEKDIAMQLVSSAENSSLDWKAQYAYIEDIGDGRGYTGGIIGFCSGTNDMLEMVKYYGTLEPSNPLATYVPALTSANGSASHAGLGDPFVAAWKKAATDPQFQAAQNHERDTEYFNPAVQQAKTDGVQTLGQFIYYDAMVMHGPGDDADSFGGIRAAAIKKAKPPAQGGNETTYLNAFLDARVTAMKAEAAHDDTSRVDTEQRMFLQAGNLTLKAPLQWKTYGDSYTISQ